MKLSVVYLAAGQLCCQHGGEHEWFSGWNHWNGCHGQDVCEAALCSRLEVRRVLTMHASFGAVFFFGKSQHFSFFTPSHDDLSAFGSSMVFCCGLLPFWSRSKAGGRH